MRLLKLGFKLDNTIKSKAIRSIVKKMLPPTLFPNWIKGNQDLLIVLVDRLVNMKGFKHSEKRRFKSYLKKNYIRLVLFTMEHIPIVKVYLRESVQLRF